MEPLFEFWAKSVREDEPAPMYSVPHHSLDVAASLLTAFRSPVDVPAATLARLADSCSKKGHGRDRVLVDARDPERSGRTATARSLSGAR